MIKKLISLAAAVLLLASALSFAVAAELYDPTASAPSALSFTFDYPNEGSQRITVNYLIPESACRFVATSSEEKTSSFGFDGSYYIQFDWAVDSKNDWHYSPDWDDGDGNYIYLDVGVDVIGKGEFLWFTYDDAVGKCADAVKTTKTDDGHKARVFDFDNHTLYARARFIYFDSEGGTSYTSPWTDTYSVNDSYNAKNTAFSGTITDLVSPALSNAFSGSVDGQSYIYFDITLGSELTDLAWKVKCATGEDLILKSQVRFDDGEWQYWSIEDELYPYTVGTRAFAVDDKMLNGTLEFRCCLAYEGNETAGIKAFNTPWSKNIVRSSDDSFSIVKNVDEPSHNATVNGKCTLCGMCSQPLGLCVFVWLTLVVIALLVAAIITRAIRRSKKHVNSIEAAARERLEKGQAEDNARKAALAVKTDVPTKPTESPKYTELNNNDKDTDKEEQ